MARQEVTEEQLKKAQIAWITNASYEELLRKWRFAPSGDPMFAGEVGEFYASEMARKREALSHAERVAVSKRIGW